MSPMDDECTRIISRLYIAIAYSIPYTRPWAPLNNITTFTLFRNLIPRHCIKITDKFNELHTSIDSALQIT